MRRCKCQRSKLVDPELAITRHRRGTSPKLSKSEQDAAVERVVHTNELTVRDRAAAILVIVFGQHIEDVIRLTWDDVTVTDELVTIRLGKTEFALPLPLGRAHARTRRCARARPDRGSPDQQTGYSAATHLGSTSTGRACGAGSSPSSVRARPDSGPCTSSPSSVRCRSSRMRLATTHPRSSATPSARRAPMRSTSPRPGTKECPRD